MSNLAAAHNRLIDYAIIADLRGADESARALRFSAHLLAMLINNEIAQGMPRAATRRECGSGASAPASPVVADDAPKGVQ